jgi:ABC-type polysaccharide/polyol phosphate transport system ATPase subunit
MEHDAKMLASLKSVENKFDGPLTLLDRAMRLWDGLRSPAVTFPGATSLGEQVANAMHRIGTDRLRHIQAEITELTRGLPEPVAFLDPPVARIENGRCGGFQIAGQPIAVVPNQSFVYIDRTLGTLTELIAENTSDAPAFALFLIGQVHYRAGVPAHITVSDEKGATLLELGMGAEWLLTSPCVRTLKLTAGQNRCLVVIVAERKFSVYCDGVKVASGPVGEGACRRAKLSVHPRLAPAGDMMIYHLSAWALSNAEAAALADRFEEPGSHVAEALLSAPFTEQAADDLARLCHNLDGLKLKPDAGQLQWIRQATDYFISQNSDFFIADLASRLPDADGLEITRAADRAHGDRVVAVKDLTVELSRNPSEERRLHRLIKSKRETFRAVDQVNFELNKGDVLGIIGHNGAGKSTLLRALCGLIDPVAGRIEIVNQFLLLRPGIGMRDELTGRENITSMAFYLGLGLQEANALSDDIVSFSELGDHIDKPVKYYSDGMRARLVFSIATSFAPDVLFLDELLGAGDIGFQEKAQARLRSFLTKVGTVIIVTHAVDFVLQSCTKGLLMHGGRQVYFGSPEETVARYLLLLEE